jgi:hypothetical protein
MFVGPAILLAILSLRGERTRAEYVAARMAELDEPPREPLPPVSVLVIVEGESPGLREALGSLAAQDYPDLELILAASFADCLPAGALPGAVKIALAGETGKVAILQAGVRAVRRRSEVFAFAASGGLVSSSWLRALVAPLSDAGVGASAGFRWYTPEPPTFWSLMRSVWNAVIAGKMSPGANEFVWNGAVAISRDTFFEARLHEFWSSFGMARALRDSGRTIAFAPGGMVAFTDRARCGEFLSQARREMALALRHLPRLWWSGLLAHILYCGAMLAAVVASVRGNRGAEWALVVLFGLGMLKGINRATLAKAELPHCKSWFDRYSWTHTFWVPLATWVWLYALIASAFERAPEK